MDGDDISIHTTEEM
jgi:hypothetical protein